MNRHIPAKAHVFVLLAFICAPVITMASTVGSTALKQWEAYRGHVQSELQRAVQTPDHFLWVDGSRERQAAVQGGSILIAPAQNRGTIAVKSGLIHHWVGAVFLPGTTAAQLVQSMQDYGNYSDIYSPAVTKSRILTRSGDEFTYSLTIISKAWKIKTGLRGEFRSRFVSAGDGIGYSTSQSTKLRELEDPDGPHEQAIEPEQDHGYVQRTFTVVRYREENDGIFVEVESLTLSRDIPFPVRWIAGPIVERISREAMAATLDKLSAKLQPLSANTRTVTKEKTNLTRSFR